MSVVGNAGSGKTRLARRIAAVLDAPHVELDSIYHLEHWQPMKADEFLERVTAITEAESWVIDGNYRTVVVDGPVWRRADTVVWLDLPRRTVLRQVTARTLGRILRGEQLWNGNRESVRDLLAWNPHKSIIRWAWTQHQKYQDRYGTAMTSPDFRHLAFLRLSSHAAADSWLAAFVQPESPPTAEGPSGNLP